MRTVKLIVTVTAAITISVCKKEYTCVCANPGGSAVVFNVKDSHKNAVVKCNEYYDKNYSSIPLIETACPIK